MKRIEVLGCLMDSATMNETVDTIIGRIERGEFTQHVAVNVAKLINMRQNAELDGSVRACDIINIDGMGLVFGARLLGFDIPERVAGIDLFYALLARAADNSLPVFLLGASEDVVSTTRKNVQQMFPNLTVAGHHHGYFWDDEESVVNKVKDSGAKLLFVAITSPRKENFINRWKDQLNVEFVMGVGGTFDVVAGKVKRAPVWMQGIGMEWLYRVIQEPRRMWKRYLVTNSQFIWLLLTAFFDKATGKK